MDEIKCPHCGKTIQISQALKHELEEKVRNEEKAKAKEEIEKAKFLAEKEAEKRFKQESEKQLLQAEKERVELEKKLEENLKEQKNQEEKIKTQALKEAAEASRLEKKEYEKKLSDMQKALEDAQRKGKQGSQQLQGEVLELDLELKLKEAFPYDEFLPIPKGVEGADIWQKVKFQGKEVGSIIWETKRTKQWSNLWLTKLKEDAARVSASESILVSQALPENTGSFDRKENVWITTYEHAVNIARYVRFLVTTVSKIKSTTSQTDEDWSRVRDYMLSDSFKHRMQSHFDGVKRLKELLETEKRTSMLRWTRQQKQIEKLDSNTVNFYAELKEIVSNLPELEELEMPLLGEGEDEDEQETLL